MKGAVTYLGDYTCKEFFPKENYHKMFWFFFPPSNYSLVMYFGISRRTSVTGFSHQWGLSSWHIFTGLIRYLFYNENGSKPLFPLDTTVHLELIMVRHSGSKKSVFSPKLLSDGHKKIMLQRCVTLSVTHTAAKSWVLAEMKHSKHPTMCVSMHWESLDSRGLFSLW